MLDLYSPKSGQELPLPAVVHLGPGIQHGILECVYAVNCHLTPSWQFQCGALLAIFPKLVEHGVQNVLTLLWKQSLILHDIQDTLSNDALECGYVLLELLRTHLRVRYRAMPTWVLVVSLLVLYEFVHHIQRTIHRRRKLVYLGPYV